jgi:dCMP deaminase
MRPSRDQVNLEVARLIAKRSTCFRRQVGCVLTDEEGFILSTGYNGVAAGRPHCNELQLVPIPEDARAFPDRKTIPEFTMPFRCEGANAPSGQNLDACQALHAEQNAILRLSDHRRVHTAYVTASPCISCVKLLLGTRCQRIVFGEEYPHATARTWWEEAGREWIHLV